MSTIAVIIPAFNEAPSIAHVIRAIPKHVTTCIVVDNNSTDETAAMAEESGAIVLHESQKGYGHACLKGMAYLEKHPPDIVVFLDGDFSDFPEDLDLLVTPLLQDEAVFCLGARTKNLREKGSLTPQQRFGNTLACTLMRWVYGSTFTDLGPFRAIQWKVLKTLDMQDKTYGWTVEMQLKILRRKLPYKEIPVRYRKRIGVSKVSGTLKGTVLAGVKIIGWIGKFYFSKWS
ncbi:MAG: glycosyltransferase family 2 protein [Flavobacteriaceae bacterium]